MCWLGQWLIVECDTTAANWLITPENFSNSAYVLSKWGHSAYINNSLLHSFLLGLQTRRPITIPPTTNKHNSLSQQFCLLLPPPEIKHYPFNKHPPDPTRTINSCHNFNCTFTEQFGAKLDLSDWEHNEIDHDVQSDQSTSTIWIQSGDTNWTGGIIQQFDTFHVRGSGTY